MPSGDPLGSMKRGSRQRSRSKSWRRPAAARRGKTDTYGRQVCDEKSLSQATPQLRAGSDSSRTLRRILGGQRCARTSIHVTRLRRHRRRSKEYLRRSLSFVDRLGIESGVFRPHTPDALPLRLGARGFFDRQPELLCVADRYRRPVALGVLDQRLSELRGECGDLVLIASFCAGERFLQLIIRPCDRVFRLLHEKGRDVVQQRRMQRICLWVGLNTALGILDRGDVAFPDANAPLGRRNWGSIGPRSLVGPMSIRSAPSTNKVPAPKRICCDRNSASTTSPRQASRSSAMVTNASTSAATPAFMSQAPRP